MAQPQNAMEIFKLLNKSNCRECHAATCLAFAAAVFKGQKRLDECPHLDPEILARFDLADAAPQTIEGDQENAMALLQRKIATLDLAAAAQRLGAPIAGGKVTVKVLGKDFSVDAKGHLSSDIHIHPWVAIPVLCYIIESTGVPVSGRWVPFRELRGGRTWYRLFEQRCEKPLKKVADTYTALFEDLIQLFNGRQVENHYSADISLVLHPPPKVPLLICYWRAEEGLASSLNVFFDATAELHLNIEALFALGTGLVRMFENIALRHG